MKTIDLKTVTAEIDSTGTVEKGRHVAVKYVNMKGIVSTMVISKRVRSNQKITKKGRPRQKTHMKNNALIPVIDHSDGDQAKDLFMFAIVGFNPDGDISQLYPIAR